MIYHRDRVANCGSLLLEELRIDTSAIVPLDSTMDSVHIRTEHFYHSCLSTARIQSAYFAFRTGISTRANEQLNHRDVVLGTVACKILNEALSRPMKEGKFHEMMNNEDQKSYIRPVQDAVWSERRQNRINNSIQLKISLLQL